MADLTHFDELYPGRFIKAGNLGDKPVTLTIATVAQETLEGEKGPELKVTLSFTRTPKQLVLCKLNGMCLKSMFGPRIADWIGKRVSFYATNQIMPMPRARGDDRPPEACIRVWGSPDIASDLSFQWAPPKRKKLTLTMRAVKRQDAPSAPEAPKPGNEPTATENASQTGSVVCPGCGASVTDLAESDREYVAQTGTCPACAK